MPLAADAMRDAEFDADAAAIADTLHSCRRFVVFDIALSPLRFITLMLLRCHYAAIRYMSALRHFIFTLLFYADYWRAAAAICYDIR